ncbi:plasmid maintenance protein [Borreliella bavariensis]|uniref:plasmid maintenance protein n=1 Tax=Borreliella bavariensis TaxID=664662 RepID=UPI001C00238B|nr:plasmid maintenance protein [Borreliella bavariensis]
MHTLIKEIDHLNCRNKPYYPLIVLILTIGYMGTKMSFGYYIGGTILIIFRENIQKYYSIKKKIDLAMLHGYLDKLENEIQVITNKYKAQKNPHKLYYELNYPIKTCALKS